MTQPNRTRPWPLLALCVVGGLGLALTVLSFPPQQFGTDSPYLRIDPDRIVTADACGACHLNAFDVWKETPHATGFGTLHKNSYAQNILEKLGGGEIRDESQCLKCHYTAIERTGEVTAVSGVSCESCHGAGQGWINIHASESVGDKATRIQRSRDGGMLHPTADPYGVVANCFECHSVPNEQLINDGGHPNGGLFELVDRVDDIRHNFAAALTGGSDANRPMGQDRKRLLFVLGRAIDYEYSIRGMARATTGGTYAKAMESRAKEARVALDEVYAATRLPELKTVLATGKSAKLIPNNADALLAAAETMRSAIQALAGKVNGAGLAAVDAFIGGGSPPAPPPVAGSTDPDPPPDAPGTATTGTDSTGAPAPPATPGTATDTPPPPPPVAAAAANVQGAKKQQPDWFRPTQFKTTLKGCNCHSQAKKWYGGDLHAASTRQVSTGRGREIATNYGLSTQEAAQGNQMCMQCHGTVKSGAESRPVRQGVGCESCHGPSSGYMNPHKAGGGAGYQHGMTRLKEAAARAQNCARCHHITDERLISSGHPSGSGFNFATANGRIKHWPGPMIDRTGAYPELSDGALTSAFNAVKSGRPVPQVTVAKIEAPAVKIKPPSKPVARQSRQSSSGGSGTAAPRAVATGGTSTALEIPDDGGFVPDDGGSSLDLPPLPAVGDSTTTEDMLLIIKRRLERLYNNRGN